MPITPGVLPLDTDYESTLDKFTLSDMLDIIQKIIEDQNDQVNVVNKGEVIAENMLTVEGDITLSPRAVQTLKDYLGIP